MTGLKGYAGLDSILYLAITGMCRKFDSTPGKGRGTERSQSSLLCSDSLVAEATKNQRETCDEGA